MHCNAPVDAYISTLHLHTCNTLVVASAVWVTSSGTIVRGTPDSNTMRAASGSVCGENTGGEWLRGLSARDSGVHCSVLCCAAPRLGVHALHSRLLALEGGITL